MKTFLWEIIFLAILTCLMIFLLVGVAAVLRGEVPRQVAIVSAMFFILGGLSYLYLSRLIFGPLTKLTRRSRKEVNNQRAHELIEDLRLSRQASKRWSEELRKKVEERTRKIALLQRKLTHFEKMASLGTMAAGIAHEIRNPLGIISTAAGCLKSSVNEDSLDKENIIFLREQIAIIEEETERMGRIAANLLSFSRLSTDRTPQLVHINDIIDESITYLRETAPERIELLQSLNRSLPPVKIDRDELRQVFLNIIQNASQAMPDGGAIEISSRQSSDGLMVEASFRDTGCGIPPENLRRIFDPFFTTKDTKKGFGLGLAVSRSIIQKAKGEISVKSTPGEGTTFTVRLPVAKIATM